MNGPNRAYRNAETITPGTALKHGGNGVLITATVAGVQKLLLAGGDEIAVTVATGSIFLHGISVIDAPASGTTATAVVTVLS